MMRLSSSITPSLFHSRLGVNVVTLCFQRTRRTFGSWVEAVYARVDLKFTTTVGGEQCVTIRLMILMQESPASASASGL